MREESHCKDINVVGGLIHCHFGVRRLLVMAVNVDAVAA